MAYQVTYVNLRYLAVRFVLWVLLGLICLIDFIRNRNARARGYKLHRAISITLGVFVLQELFTLAWIGKAAPDPTATIEAGEDDHTLYGIMLFFYNLAESMFLGLMLLMSTGWQITQRKVRHRAGVLMLPAIHFITSLIQDYILETHAGHSSSSANASGLVEGTERQVLFLSSFIALLTLIYSWYFVFVCIGEERRVLSEKIKEKESPTTIAVPGVTVGVSTTDSGANDGAAAPSSEAGSVNSDGGSGSEPTESVAADAAAAAPEESTISSTLGLPPPPSADCSALSVDETLDVDEDLDEDSTVPMKAKLRMLTQFQVLVQLYFFAVLATLFFDIFQAAVSESSADSPVARITLDLLVFLFMASLVYIFRLRSHNPYFMLEDYSAFEAGVEAGEEVDVIPMSRVLPSDFGEEEDSGDASKALPRGTFVIDDDDDEEEIWSADRHSFDNQSTA